MAEDKTVLIKTAYSYYQKADWDRAIEEYHKLADLDPKDLNVHNMLADIYSKKGDAQEALQQYDLVAQGFDQKNQVDKVLQVYKRMLKLVPNDPELLTAVKNLVDKYLTRASQMEDQDAEKAAEIYRSVLKVEPERVEANLQYSRLLAKMGQKFEAIKTLMGLVESLDPATQTGRLVEVLQAVTEMDPLNIEAREKLVDILINARQTEPAVKSLQDLIEIHISKNDFNNAQQAAQRAIELGDQNAYYHLGVIYFNLQKYPESRTAFKKFLEQQETHVGALKYLALTFLRLNQTAEAIQVYLRVLSVYFNENLIDEAKEVRKTILELDPANEGVKQFALDPPVTLPEPNVAEEAKQPAPHVEDTRKETEEQQALLAQAHSFTEKGLYEQAINVYLDMLKLWPQMPDIRIRLQQVYALMARALEPAEKYPSPDAIKAELEKELREQMRKELQEQAREVQERQHEMERKRELEQLKLKQELETKLFEQVQRSKEEEMRLKLTREFEERNRSLALEKEKLEKEKAETFNRSKEDDLRSQLTKEFEQKQRLFEMEKERLEREKTESYDRLKAELEETRSSMERKIREQIESELKGKLEKDAQREAELKAALQQEEERRRQEEEQRQRYIAQSKEQDEAKARINQEIMQGMERLRMEKEKESQQAVSLASEAEKTGAQTGKDKKSSTGDGREILDDPFVRQTLAEIYAKQGLYVEALKIYERILSEEPNNEDIREKLRDILRLKGI